jgi:hypothetical protein
MTDTELRKLVGIAKICKSENTESTPKSEAV